MWLQTPPLALLGACSKLYTSATYAQKARVPMHTPKECSKQQQKKTSCIDQPETSLSVTQRQKASLLMQFSHKLRDPRNLENHSMLMVDIVSSRRLAQTAIRLRAVCGHRGKNLQRIGVWLASLVPFTTMPCIWNVTRNIVNVVPFPLTTSPPPPTSPPPLLPIPPPSQPAPFLPPPTPQKVKKQTF